MSQKVIRKGDICRIRHNNSGHAFPENTLVVIKECYPKRAEISTRLKAATRNEWWWVEPGDVTLFERGNYNEDDDW